MSVTKKTVSLSSDLVEEVQGISSNFSLLVETALRDYVHRYHVKKALESFGKWESRDTDSVIIVNDLRAEEGRKRDVRYIAVVEPHLKRVFLSPFTPRRCRGVPCNSSGACSSCDISSRVK